VLAQQYLDETYDVEYSIPSCRRLLKEAGLSYQKPRRTAAESDAEEQETFRKELKKAAGDGRQSSLYRPNQEIRAS
jgi:transposase